MRVLVILGNRNNDDGTMSELMLQRLQLATTIIDNYSVDKIVLCGGIANPTANISEAQVMYDYLTARGITDQLLIKEDQSLTTKQNAKYACDIITTLRTVESIILITSPEHMKRPYLNPYRLFRRALPRHIKIYPYSKQGDTINDQLS